MKGSEEADKIKGFQISSCAGQRGCQNRAVIMEDLPGRIEEALVKHNLKSYLIRRVKAPLKIHHEFRVSISDCPNGCSKPQIVDIGLVGACQPVVSKELCSECKRCIKTCKEDAMALKEGSPVIDDSRCLHCGQCIKICPTGTLREGFKGYRVMIGGKLGRHPRLGTELIGAYDSEEVLDLIDQCLKHYQLNGVKGERFGDVLENTGLEWIKKQII